MNPDMNRNLGLRDIETELEEARQKYNRWGKWGEDDVIGTLNFVTPEMRTNALRNATQGKFISLTQPFDENGPQDGFRGRINIQHIMRDSGSDAMAEKQGFPHGFGGADDAVYMPLQVSTQWDGLGHIYDRKMTWNGRPCSLINGMGDSITGMEKYAHLFTGRGVLLDVGRAIGDENGELPDGYVITSEELDETARKQGVSVGTGDFVMLRTGRYARVAREGWQKYAGGPCAGISFTTLDWLYRTEIAAIASDTWGVETIPREFPQPCFSPLHQIAIPHMGLFLGEMFDLEALAEDCASDGIYEFLFIGNAIPVKGAVGAPLHPIAIK